MTFRQLFVGMEVFVELTDPRANAGPELGPIKYLVESRLSWQMGDICAVLPLRLHLESHTNLRLQPESTMY